MRLPLPTVTSFKCPKYPPKAELARIGGTVRRQVTTDGHRVVQVKTVSGPAILAEPAEKNIRTWKFAEHKPTTFAVTFYYVNEGRYTPDPITKCSAKMELPTKVTVSTKFAFP